MLRRFPGRTLDELDGMDWGRFARAVEAERMEAVELRRRAYLKGDAKDLSDAEWEALDYHETLTNGKRAA